MLFQYLLLTTFVIRWPVCPFHSPPRSRFAKPVMRSSTACTSGTTFLPSTWSDAPRGARKAT